MISQRRSLWWSLIALSAMCASSCSSMLSSNTAARSARQAGATSVDTGLSNSGRADAASDETGLPPLTPCTDPAVSRLKVWELQVVGGTQKPATGSVLRKVGDAYELYVEWTLAGSSSYGTANAPLGNQGEYTHRADPSQHAVDISSASGITLEYATTGNTYLQIRTGTVPHGGDHFRADMPATRGDFKTVTLEFAGFRRPGGQVPPSADILKDVFSFTFVAAGTTQLTLRQVRVAGFTPPCN